MQAHALWGGSTTLDEQKRQADNGPTEANTTSDKNRQGGGWEENIVLAVESVGLNTVRGTILDTTELVQE